MIESIRKVLSWAKIFHAYLQRCTSNPVRLKIWNPWLKPCTILRSAFYGTKMWNKTKFQNLCLQTRIRSQLPYHRPRWHTNASNLLCHTFKNESSLRRKCDSEWNKMGKASFLYIFPVCQTNSGHWTKVLLEQKYYWESMFLKNWMMVDFSFNLWLKLTLMSLWALKWLPWQSYKCCLKI